VVSIKKKAYFGVPKKISIEIDEQNSNSEDAIL